MFNNTVNLAPSSVTPDYDRASLIDGPTNRRTLRATADGKVELSIAHTESTENKGFSTQRSNVRIARTFDVPDSDAVVVGYVQLTISIPRDIVTVTDLAKLVTELVNFLYYGDNAAEQNIISVTDTPLVANVTRLYAGEP